MKTFLAIYTGSSANASFEKWHAMNEANRKQKEAARLFLNHPHFAIFPGDGVEIMEILPVPGM